LIRRVPAQVPGGNRIAVLLPAKDEALVIATTLKSILAAGVLAADIYVVDDGSSDDTGEIAHGFGVNVLRNETNVGKARSIARARAHFDLCRRYDIIATTDADTQMHPDYFQVVRTKFQEGPDVAVVCGRCVSIPHNWLTAYRALLFFVVNSIYRDGMSNMGVITVAPGPASSYRADVFAQVDWNNDTIVEDMDVTIQIHRKKLGRIIHAQDAIVFTQDPRVLRDYVKQTVRWQTGNWQIALKYRMWTGLEKIDWEFKLLLGEGLFFASWILLLPLLAITRPLLVAWVCGCDAMFLASLSLLCSMRERRPDVLTFSFMYPAMRFVDCGVFCYCFWKTVVQRRTIQGWTSVARY